MTRPDELMHRPQARNFYIPELLELSQNGAIRIPRFQRSFVWDDRNVRDLFDSIWRGFPIGTILLWRNKASKGVVDFGPLSIPVEERTDALWVVDGQQRIISIVGVLGSRHRHVDRRFEVYFDLRRGRFVTGRGRPAPPTWLPLHQAVETRPLLSWLRDHAKDLEPEDFDAADAVGGALRDYQVPAYIVAGEDDSLLRTIFDRVNSAGKPIGRADVFHALFASDTEPGSPATVVTSLRRLSFGELDSDRVVQSLLALRGGNVQRDLHDEFAPDEDPADWYQKTEEALALAISFLRVLGIPHLRLVPSTLPLPVLAAFYYLHQDPEPWTQRLLSRWLWRGWVHGFGRRGQTPALRQAIYYVNPKHVLPSSAPSEDEAVISLVAAVPDEESHLLRLNPFRTDSAAGRIALLALASLNPLTPDGGDINVGEELERHGVRAVTEIVKGHRAEVGARGLWPVEAKPPTGDEPRSVLASHGITPEAARLLQKRKVREFLDVRNMFVEDLVARYIAARVEAKSLIRPSLQSLIVEDEE